MTVLHITDLCKSYGKKHVLSHLNLTIDVPGIWALIAPNGTGKTTLFDCITNLQKIDSGTIEVVGMKHTNPSIFHKVSYLQNNTVLYPELTGLDHLQFLQQTHHLPKDRIMGTAQLVGIQDYMKLPVKTYSLGMKQHLLLALAILTQPSLLLLDEPFNGLDPTSYVQTRQLLKKLAANGATVILSSHQLQEIDLLTTQLLFLKDGHIIQTNHAHDETTFRLQLTNLSEGATWLQRRGYLPKTRGDFLEVSVLHTQLDNFLSTLAACPAHVLWMDQQHHYSEHFYQEFFMK